MGLIESLIDGLLEIILVIINAPLQPLLYAVKSLLTDPVGISLFGSLWGIMVYIISLFYGLLLLYAGFNFIISGHDVVKRENAKVWLKNVLIMTVLIQSSYFLYQLILSISGLLTSGVMGLIDPNFFLFTLDSLINIGLEISLGGVYMLVLLLSTIILAVRYIIVSMGVVLMPWAIFLYFIPPLKAYGKLIINFLGVNIFITFVDSIILLASSRLVEVSIFGSFEILLMISAFLLINLITLYAMFFTIVKSALGITSEVTSKVGLVKALLGGA